MEWYEAEVCALEAKFAGPRAGVGAPVFYGSSSMRLWTTLAEDFDPRVVNLGFGGSTMEACDYFFTRLLPPVRPRSLLLYAGDNDLGDGQSPEQTLVWFRSIADKVAEYLGPIPFGFLSVKPSPARYAIIDRMRRLNELVRREIESRPGGYYIDVFPAMLDSAGRPRPEYFIEDELHLSHSGYRLWSGILESYRHQIFT